MNKEKESNISVINGVRVEDDGDVIHFTLDDEQDLSSKTTNKKPLERIWRMKPYIKVRDFNKQGGDPMRPEDNKSVNGVEIGLKFDF